MNSRRTIFFFSIAVALLFGGALFIPQNARAAEACSFTRDLGLGDTGEDIRCLQRYLNSEGFTVADSGVGSPGNETSLFREKTEDAVRRWQVAKLISPATGNWGPLSRGLYERLIVSPTPTPTLTPTPDPEPTQSTEEKTARTRLLAALNAIEDAESDFEDAEDDDADTGDAEDFIEDAKDELFDALRAFIEEEYEEAIDFADGARERAHDAQDEIDSDSNSDGADEADAEEALDDADQMIEDAEDEVAEAEDDGEDTGNAEDLLDEANDLLDDAEEAFDAEDWDEVIDLANEIEDLVDEALDSID
ncbi:MAG: peptidoglycan-binding protein [Patescibacteria group bacterium]